MDERDLVEVGVEEGERALTVSPDDERWLVVDGRRWRRQDSSLPPDVAQRLLSHLGRGRSAVRSLLRAGEDPAPARRRELSVEVSGEGRFPELDLRHVTDRVDGAGGSIALSASQHRTVVRVSLPATERTVDGLLLTPQPAGG